MEQILITYFLEFDADHETPGSANLNKRDLGEVKEKIKNSYSDLSQVSVSEGTDNEGWPAVDIVLLKNEVEALEKKAGEEIEFIIFDAIRDIEVEDDSFVSHSFEGNWDKAVSLGIKEVKSTRQLIESLEKITSKKVKLK